MELAATQSKPDRTAGTDINAIEMMDHNRETFDDFHEDTEKENDFRKMMLQLKTANPDDKIPGQ